MPSPVAVPLCTPTSGGTAVHSHQRWIRGPFPPHPCHHLLFADFCMRAVITGVRICISVPRARQTGRLPVPGDRSPPGPVVFPEFSCPWWGGGRPEIRLLLCVTPVPHGQADGKSRCSCPLGVAVARAEALTLHRASPPCVPRAAKWTGPRLCAGLLRAQVPASPGLAPGWLSARTQGPCREGSDRRHRELGASGRQGLSCHQDRNG